MVEEATSQSKISDKFRKRCEEIATLQRHTLGRYAFEPLTAYELAQELQATIYPLDELPGADPIMVANVLAKTGWSAAITQRQPLVIIHNPTHSAARQQSNLMHELAHVLLNHPSGSLDTITGVLIFSAVHEAEATYLGGCLLLPKRAAEWASQKKFTVEQAMIYYGASREMIVWRCRMSGVRLSE